MAKGLKMNNNYVAIMAGGIGSRFWPASRINLPKQFLDILGTGETLIQSTYNRFLKVCDEDKIFILTNEDYVGLVKEQLPDIKDSQILAEPMRKNTAPSIAYASYKIASIDSNANIIVAPSDHIILKEQAFINKVKQAFEFVSKNDALCTMGIRPSRPDTGYGYIQFIEEHEGETIHKVKTFTEKPNLQTAKQFIDSGDFLWNAGIFIWNVKSIIKAFHENLQEIGEIFDEIKGQINTDKEVSFIERAFAECPNISIDFGVMEKAENVYVLPANFGWSDLGTWASLYEEKKKDYLNNAVSGKKVIIYDASNNIIDVPNNKLVVIEGLENYIVVDTKDVLLICNKNKEQKIKEFTQDIKNKDWDKFL
ncbi:MAG: sugar phosphate nucleotidyltransferase [Chitinophagales bacterium]|nr:sugar phosphate nucleotidyltransferase [Chitinophagales bacterium]